MVNLCEIKGKEYTEKGADYQQDFQQKSPARGQGLARSRQPFEKVGLHRMLFRPLSALQLLDAFLQGGNDLQVVA